MKKILLIAATALVASFALPAFASGGTCADFLEMDITGQETAVMDLAEEYGMTTAEAITAGVNGCTGHLTDDLSTAFEDAEG